VLHTLLRRVTLMAVIITLFALAPAATAGQASCESRVNNTHAKLLECVTLDGVREHQEAFQAIADANGGTRLAGTPGYEASVDYVVEKATAAGYNVTRHSFPFVFIAPPTLQQLAPVLATYETGAFTGTGFGSASGDVTPADINLVSPQTTTSGCQGAFTEAAVGAPIVPDPGGPDDFAGLAAGDIALVQRGSCSFALKALNAQAAGASAVIIFNQGTPDRLPLIVGTLAPHTLNIPVVGASFAAGVALAAAGSQATVTIDPPENILVENVIAESRSGNPNNVVMVGAHLDSVAAGPGINDNGSGSAAILEVAEQMAQVRPRNMVRFAWWGAEEAGLVGSRAYVNGLSQAEQDKIALYLNFDMVGSPNHVFFIYDGDDSDATGAGPGPAGSDKIEEVFERYYADRGLPFKGTDFSGRSDYGPFIAVGIPSGGLFTGAEGVKTAQEAIDFGGTAGQQYDPCYHLVCDTIDNVNLEALDINSDAIAYATLQYAMNTSDINGVRGKGNFPPVEPPSS
jgi:Zn-dependent M28 family amino/carboxypeptidase